MKKVLKSKSRKLKSELDLATNLWLEWQVAKDANDENDLLSFNFSLVTKEVSSLDSFKVSIPVLALYQIAEKYNWLQVLRGPRHRPKDPFELVRFIQLLEQLREV